MRSTPASAVCRLSGGAAWGVLTVSSAHAGQVSKAAPTKPENTDILVIARRPDLVVDGRLPRCVRRSGDPKDLVNVSHQQKGSQMMVVLDAKTGLARMKWDTDPIGGDDWQRAGTEIRSYVFRAPANGDPLCIGSRRSDAEGFAQLRRIVDATPFRGKGVRFTGYIASNQGADTRIWLAAGKKEREVIAGNSTQTVSLSRRVGWQAFTYEIPFIPEESWSISYGFLLWGTGDVWVTEPKLEAIPARGRGRDLVGTRLR